MSNTASRSPVKGPNITLVQFSSVPFNPQANFDKAAEYVRAAAAVGSDLVVFPEYLLTGRPPTPGADVDEEGIWIAKFQDLARTHSIDIVPGTIVERMALTDSVLKNTAYYIDRHGQILGRYQKVNLFPNEHGFFIPGARSQQQRVFATRWGLVGLLVSWDIMYPETCRMLFNQAHELAGKGSMSRGYLHDPHRDELVMIICPSSWAVPPEYREREAKRIDAVCLTRAFENHVAVVFCNSARTFTIDETHTGRSQVCLPARGTIERAEADQEEEIIVRELDLGALLEAEEMWRIREDLHKITGSPFSTRRF
ncbi:carbon-nitrogen hydrolase [Endogone sp. FLAS-F59071]|nr:carbon-nitrogen hydrolase [Endogone sp. FLAS-F59071]|eukprot:RUS19826.1 carbon-nitrogen hydrolase [Endogone sp. FLAS-F59071]